MSGTAGAPDDRAYLLVVRHAKAGRGGGAGSVIAPSALDELHAVGERLAETLEALRIVPGEDIRIGSTVVGDSEIAKETASLIRSELAARNLDAGAVVLTLDLDGRHAAPLSPGAQGEVEAARSFVLQQLRKARGAGRNAVLVVGHQPAVGLICEGLLSRRWRPSPGAVPLSHGGVACLVGRHDGSELRDVHLRWVIAPSDPVALDQVRAKVASKMQVAAVLAGLIGTGLVFVLQDLLSTARAADASLVFQYAAALTLFVGAALNLATVYAYDVLLMPTRFWAEPRRLLPSVNSAGRTIRGTPRWLVWRPPSADLIVIYQNMIRVWSRLFMPATAFTAIGVACMGLALVRPPDPGTIGLVAIGEAALALLVVAYVRRMWPVLGVED
jgi:hypothetical protein